MNRSHIFKAESLSNELLELLDFFFHLGKKKKIIHLLLTDVIMPTMSGGDLAASLKMLRPKLKVLFMSGYSGDLVANHGVLEAETNLLEKPFTKHALLSKVRAILDN